MRAAVLVMLVLTPLVAVGDDPAAEKQAALDRACEAARDRALAPLRNDIRAECLADGRDAETCQREAADFNGNRIGGRSPLFYDLPECVAAFEYLRDGDR